MDAILLAEKNIKTEHDAALNQWRLHIERLQYEADRAERRFQAVEPENRLVARTLENQWETCLHQLQAAKNEFEQCQRQRPEALTPEQRDHIHTLSKDIKLVWQAPTTTYRDKKELLQILLQEVNISVDRTLNTAHLIIRWQTDAVTEIDMDLPKRNSPTIRTAQDTIDLVRRLAVHYNDAMIAGILNRQGRQTARGHRFTANRVGNLRRHWNIPKFDPTSVSPDEGELVTVQKAAEILDVASGTVHRWLLDGFIAGEQITPGAPWRIRMTEDLKSRFVQQPPEGYVTMKEAKKLLGVSRQTVLHRVKSGKLPAVHVRKGKQMGLYIKVIDKQMDLFNQLS
jgi:excisionase family DNA binding protein